MADLTVSSDIDSFMASANNVAARTSLGVPAATTTISAGTGLTGGGDLSANRTLSVSSAVVVRDSNQNITANSVIEGFSSIVASGTQVVLTVASVPSYLVTGSGGQTIKLPDATTLQNGVVYLFNNNQSSGSILVNNDSNTLIATIPSGGFSAVSLLSNLTAAGSWERHEQAPSNVSWSTNTLDYSGSITSATWNGSAVAVNRGGTGATTAGNALTNLGAAPSSRTITAGTGLIGGGDLTADRTLAVSYGTTSGTAAQGNDSRLSDSRTPTAHASTHAAAGSDPITITAAQISGSLTQNTSGTAAGLSSTLAVTSGGTGATSQQAAINALAGATTSGQFLRGDGANVTLSSIQAADVPTLNQNTTGTSSNVTGTVAIANGGTGATTVEAAKNTLGSPQSATIRHNSNLVLATAGTLTGATWTSGSTTLTFTSSTVTLVPGMSISAVGLTAAVIRTVDSSTQVTMSLPATAGGSGSVTVYNATTSTLVSSSIVTMDGRTIQVGDIVLLTAQAAYSHVGPWKVDSIGTGFNLSRPSWFTGSLTGSMLFNVQLGASNAGFIISVFPYTSNTTASIGLDPLQANVVGQRANNAITGGNTFTAKQTLAAGSTTGAPMGFQAGVVMTTPVAHSVEWDGNLMYLTTSAGVRTTNLSFVAAPGNATSTGITGQVAFDGTGFYVCIATNTWRKATLATF